MAQKFFEIARKKRWLPGAAPDETTVCKFRHLLERRALGGPIFATVKAHLKASGLRLSTGTIVDATIISTVIDQESFGPA